MSPFALKLHQKAKKLSPYEHIQSPPTPSGKILFDPLKILQNGVNTHSQNLELAGLYNITFLTGQKYAYHLRERSKAKGQYHSSLHRHREFHTPLNKTVLRLYYTQCNHFVV
jgi:hypothetical protein